MFAAIATIVAYVLIALVLPFDRRERMRHQIANKWGQSIVWANPFWHLSVKGRDHIQKNKSYVIVANHASLADIVCIHCLGNHFKWIAKESLFRVPVLGWTMSLLGYIPLKRGEHGSIRDTMKEARKCLERGVSVLFFSEGTRSESGKLAPFKNGAFKLAVESKTPVLPIAISGTEKALQKGRFLVASRLQGVLTVLEPVEVTGYEQDQYEELKARVWKMIHDVLTKNSA